MKRMFITAIMLALFVVCAKADFIIEKKDGKTLQVDSPLSFMQNAGTDSWSPSIGNRYDAAYDLENISAIYLNPYSVDIKATLLSEPLHSYAAFTIKSDDETAAYFCFLAVSDMDLAMTGQYVYIPEEATDEDVFQDMVDRLNSQVSQDKSFKDVLDEQVASGEIMRRGSVEKYAAMNLPAGRNFTLVIAGVDADGKQISPVQRLAFTTAPIEQIDCDFDVTTSVDVRKVTFNITPESPDVYWYFGAVEAERWENLTAFYQDDISSFVANECAMSIRNIRFSDATLSSKECFEQVCHKGSLQNFTKEFDYSNKEYVYYAAVLDYEDVDGSFTVYGLSKQALVETVKTGTAEMIDMTLRVEAAVSSPESGHLTITPSSNDDSYVFDCVPLARWKNMTDEERQSSWNDRKDTYYNVGIGVYTGVQESDVKLYPNTEYIAFAYGYADKSATTPMFSTTFTTPAISEEPAFNLSVDVSNISYTNASFTIKPNRDDVYYKLGLTAAAGFSIDNIKQSVEDDIAYTQNYMVDNSSTYDNYVIAEDVEASCRRGAFSAGTVYSLDGTISLTPNTQYVVYWVAVDTKTGKCTESGTKEFSTPKMYGGKATVKVNIGKFYNSKEAHDNVDAEKFYDREDRVVIPIEITGVSDDAVEVWYGFSGGANFSTVTDEWLFDGGRIVARWDDLDKVMYRNGEGYWDMVWFFFAAKDKDGVFGPITRVYIDTIEGNESPIEELKQFYEEHKDNMY